MTWQEGAGFNRPALSAGLPRWVVRCQALTRPPLPPLPSPQFLALREVKRKICRDLESNARRIEEINRKLGVSERHWSVAIHPDEEPERREQVGFCD